MGYSTQPLTPAQIAAQALSAEPLAPTGAVCETFPRYNSGSQSLVVLTASGTMHLTAMACRMGSTITNLSHRSGTTGANIPTNWWFALYDSSLNLIQQSTDQLTAAWAASAIKTLAIDSVPVTAGARVASATVTLTFPTLSLPLTYYFAVGDSIVVSNANIAAYNGTWTITAIPSATTLTYTSGGSATDNLAAPFPTVQMAAGKRTFPVTVSGLYYAAFSVTATAVPTSTGASGYTGLSSQAPAGSGDSSTALTGTAPSPAASLGAGTNVVPYIWGT